MSMNQHRVDTTKMTKVMEAFVNGEVIECKSLDAPESEQRWNVISMPGWNWVKFDFRVASIKVTKFCVLYGTLEHGVEFLVGNFATHDAAVAYAEEHEHSSMPWMVKPIEQVMAEKK